MDAEQVPAHVVAVDQVVALNIGYWRRAAGMTQEQLGSLTGLSAGNVSAIERSGEPGRERRRFDAQSLAEFALALGVPLIALFLPPPDDGGAVQYLTSMPGWGGPHEEDMGGLLTLLMPDSDDDSAVLEEYRKRLKLAVEKYMDPSWGADVAAWLGRRESAAKMTARAGRLRRDQQILLDMAAEQGQLARAIEDELKAGGAG